MASTLYWSRQIALCFEKWCGCGFSTYDIKNCYICAVLFPTASFLLLSDVSNQYKEYSRKYCVSEEEKMAIVWEAFILYVIKSFERLELAIRGEVQSHGYRHCLHHQGKYDVYLLLVIPFPVSGNGDIPQNFGFASGSRGC